jgi:hypothetical protein
MQRRRRERLDLARRGVDVGPVQGSDDQGLLPCQAPLLEWLMNHILLKKKGGVLGVAYPE